MFYCIWNVEEEIKGGYFYWVLEEIVGVCWY